MRPTARPSGDREPVQAEAVRDAPNVLGDIRDATAGPAGRLTVPGPVEGQPAHTATEVDVRVAPARQPAARRAVDRHDRHATRVAPLGDRKGSSVGRRYPVLDV